MSIDSADRSAMPMPENAADAAIVETAVVPTDSADSVVPTESTESAVPTESTDSAEPTVTFGDLGLPEAIVRKLNQNGVVTPFPIQAATIPDALSGRDILGRGRTGS